MRRAVVVAVVVVCIFQAATASADHPNRPGRPQRPARPDHPDTERSLARFLRPSPEIREYCVPDLPPPNFCVDRTLRTTFLANRIVPELIGAMKYRVGLKVAFENRTDVVATFVNKTVAATQPNVTFSESANSTQYTLAMLDPDASSRWNATNGPILHWLVTNIPSGDVTKGFTVAPYRGPGAAFGNGLHRYVLLALQQKRGTVNLTPINVTDPTSRRNFDVVKLIIDNELDPIGGTFFFSQF